MRALRTRRPCSRVSHRSIWRSAGREREKGFESLAADADYAAYAILASYQHLMRYQNFWRAALVKGATRSVFWEPFRASGLRTMQLTVECHERRIGRSLSEDEIGRIRFAFQMANGAINNGIINRPGPLLPGTPDSKPRWCVASRPCQA